MAIYTYDDPHQIEVGLRLFVPLLNCVFVISTSYMNSIFVSKSQRFPLILKIVLVRYYCLFYIFSKTVWFLFE